MLPPIQPYLFFEGRCEEALDFYKKALGAEVAMLMRYSDSPDPPPKECMPADPRKVMHAELKVAGASVMASDGMANGKPVFQGFGLSLPAKDEAQADRYFNALGEGGTVMMPMGKTFFSPRFGMVTDKFGVMWMVIVPPPV